MMGRRSGSTHLTFALLFCCLVGGCGEARSATAEVHSAPSRIFSHPEPPPPLAEPERAAPAPAPRSIAAVDALQHDGIPWLVERAIARGELPGAVVAIGTRAGLLYLQAFGERTRGEPMTVDTRFDLASVTKPIATAASVMALVEQGVLDLDAPVSRYLPEFRGWDKARITVRDLLVHTSGLPKVSPLADFEQGREHALRSIGRLPLLTPRGLRFEYSDLGFIVLGELVSRTSGARLDAFARERLFAPLDMRETMFLPPIEEASRSAPTEERDNRVIRGVVDDPRAYRLGGVAGHAGLFSTAGDLARFAQMLLGKGELDGKRVLSEETVQRFLEPRQAGDARRALGWDVESTYALGRGRTMSAQTVGHGGYTGTSLWIDPDADVFVILLSNRVHVGQGGTIHPLASSVADLAVRARRSFEQRELFAGIDVLADEGFARLRGRNIAVLSHGAARDRRGVRTIDRLLSAPEVHVRAVLAPEHGFDANREGHVAHGSFGAVPLYSLFGKTRRPDASMLRGVDTLVIDLVDVGARFYTYMSTVAVSIEAAAALGIEVVLLDRPNPIDGVKVEGPMSEPSFASFVNYHPLPLRHGMTAGELSLWLMRERNIAAKLHVVRVEHWRREAWLGDTDLAWHAPSPNLRTKEQAMLYPAVALVEGTNVSVGRGTQQAFAVVGAPFIKGDELAGELARHSLPGVAVTATRFRPLVGPYAGTRVEGVALELRDAHAFSASTTGLTLIRALASLYKDSWDTTRLEKLVAHRRTLELLLGDTPLAQIESAWRDELAAFEASRRATLLYD
jgi:uncharacterized protein YbbC (DUF1343 family)